MRTKKYITYVASITCAILAFGLVMWFGGPYLLAFKFYGMNLQDWHRGPDDASVTIEVYPSFSCSSCVEYERMVLQALELYPGQVSMVYHHFAVGDYSIKVAQALEAAGEQGKFWEMHDKLIEEMPPTTSELITCAEEVGLDTQQFAEALDSKRIARRVEAATQRAKLAGANIGSIFVNGKRLKKGPDMWTELTQAIDEQLAQLEASPSD